jgi:hypothetical protein
MSPYPFLTFIPPTLLGILPATVVGHILESLIYGHAVDLSLLASQSADANLDLPPNSTEWEECETAGRTIDHDPYEDQKYFPMKDLIRSIPSASHLG